MDMTAICTGFKGSPALLDEYLRRMRAYAPGHGIYVAQQLDGPPYSASLARDVAALAALQDGCKHLTFQDVDLAPVSGVDYGGSPLNTWFLNGGGVRIPADWFTLINGWNPASSGWGSEECELWGRLDSYELELPNWVQGCQSDGAVVCSLDGKSAWALGYEGSGVTVVPSDPIIPNGYDPSWCLPVRQQYNKEILRGIEQMSDVTRRLYYQNNGLNRVYLSSAEVVSQDGVTIILYKRYEILKPEG